MATHRFLPTRMYALVALLAVLTTSFVSISAEPGHADTVQFPYSGMTAKSVVSGVVASNGAPVYAADIIAVAHPTGDALDALPLDTEVPTLLVGATSSNAEGRFSVNVDPAALPSQYVDEKRRVQIELVVADGTKEVRWDTTAVPAGHPVPIGGGEELCGVDVTNGCDLGEPVYVVPGAAGAPSINVVVATAGGEAVTPLWSTAKTDAIGASVPQQLVIDLGDQPKVYDANDNPSTWMTAPAGEEVQPVPEGQEPAPVATEPAPSGPVSAAVAAALREASTAPRSTDFSFVDQAVQAGTITAGQMSAGQIAAAAKRVPCGWFLRQHFYGREEQYMGVHTWSGGMGTVTQSTGSDHTLSVGAKAAKEKKYSVSGSITLSLKRGQEDEISRVNEAWVIGTVNYARFENICGQGQRIKPTSMGDPIKTFKRALHPTFNRACIDRFAGSRTTMTQSRNATVAAAVEVGGFSEPISAGFPEL
ncbi:hypothetical protein AB0O34_20670 [Sphaerisporangium sp. NPDC088356]|uniref:hypothetical protein n=1 Tax=Sphaerisporangium sp. NPDC088356 TaxID=3154871 RepID=UPI003430B00C